MRPNQRHNPRYTLKEWKWVLPRDTEHSVRQISSIMLKTLVYTRRQIRKVSSLVDPSDAGYTGTRL